MAEQIKTTFRCGCGVVETTDNDVGIEPLLPDGWRWFGILQHGVEHDILHCTECAKKFGVRNWPGGVSTKP